MVKVAKMAKVSQATVSRVFNGNPTVSRESVENVKRAAALLGYKAKRKPRTSTSGVLKVAAISLGSEEMAAFFGGHSICIEKIERELAKNNVELLRFNVTDVASIPAVILSGEVSGLILTGYTLDFEVLEKLESFPKVWLNSHTTKDGDVILPGNVEIGKLALDYFLKRGHSKLGVLNAYLANPAVVSRCEYFKHAASLAGVKVTDFIYKGLKSQNWQEFEQNVEVLVKEFIKSDNRPTAVFVPVDTEVALVYRFFTKYGIKIGKGGVEILGCDNDTATRVALYPRPSTIDIGTEILIRQAVQLLLWRIESPNVDRNISIVVEPKLILGEV
ncbi:Ribose operon repressor [Limihaloglobus sulfuriphilus]|uniref:Ribose operon repressor n=2 Tax=Limihaloglobus sulfuriphilus TaxID=1851148 RepID=A0A1Q2ME40_9BACT|nr:Ribose operon repressor [Limihaloglobus sulfuriphilus]